MHTLVKDIRFKVVNQSVSFYFSFILFIVRSFEFNIWNKNWTLKV